MFGPWACPTGPPTSARWPAAQAGRRGRGAETSPSTTPFRALCRRHRLHPAVHLPGRHAAQPRRFGAEARKAGLEVVGQMAFGLDYAETLLRRWRRAFEAALPRCVPRVFDGPSSASGRLYLCYCRAGFDEAPHRCRAVPPAQAGRPPPGPVMPSHPMYRPLAARRLSARRPVEGALRGALSCHGMVGLHAGRRGPSRAAQGADEGAWRRRLPAARCWVAASSLVGVQAVRRHHALERPGR